MAYIDKVIADDETVLELGRVHWFYAFQGLLWFLAPVLLWFAFEAAIFLTPSLNKAPMLVATFEMRQYVFAALSVAGFVIFFFSCIHMFVTELALTDKRLIFVVKSHTSMVANELRDVGNRTDKNCLFSMAGVFPQYFRTNEVKDLRYDV